MAATAAGSSGAIIAASRIIPWRNEGRKPMRRHASRNSAYAATSTSPAEKGTRGLAAGGWPATRDDSKSSGSRSCFNKRHESDPIAGREHTPWEHGLHLGRRQPRRRRPARVDKKGQRRPLRCSAPGFLPRRARGLSGSAKTPERDAGANL